jgi:Mg/Co/Ni transporter MgtE
MEPLRPRVVREETKMDLRVSLAQAFAAGYPSEAAAALERRPPEEVARVLRALPRETAAVLLRRMAPGTATGAIEHLEPAVAAGIFLGFPIDDVLALLRRTAGACRDAIIAAMPEERAIALRSVIGFPDKTAGALMDPHVVALPGDLTAEESLQALHRQAEQALHNLYVVDRDRVLVGVLNLQELIAADPRDRLDAVSKSARHRLDPAAGVHAIVTHPGWREVYSLPVVDEGGRFLGAVRYRTFRRLEDELRGVGSETGEVTARALGDLFWAGVVGVVGAMAATAPPGHPSGSVPRAEDPSSIARGPDTAAGSPQHPPTEEG